ncbi:hypothetical protein CEE75_10580 [Lactobacillus crispatus]|uniref:Uncharacterized protein n=1 Tax=Lactobacillus crispatus TaxID=47770 RepID=A0A4R6CRK5_9LACO|nr:hypothetical protein [Lactobacillus crispatus]TDN29488.1 hypothetical protein CEE75_10580 [Lactobacillus crispatus]
MAELNENTFWISGIINGEYRECDGPYTTTKDMSDKGYPYVTKTPNPNFTHQKYDYTAHEWVDTSSEALLHTVEDVTELKSNSQSNTQSNDELDKKLDKLTTLVTMSNVQTGKLMQEVQNLKKQAQPATQSTEPTQATATANEGGNK